MSLPLRVPGLAIAQVGQSVAPVMSMAMVFLIYSLELLTIFLVQVKPISSTAAII